MDVLNILEKLNKYTQIQRCTFFLETREYKYVCKILDMINIVISNLSLYEANRKNLKVYKDDKETVKNIKEIMDFNEQRINNALNSLEEIYNLYREGGNID